MSDCRNILLPTFILLSAGCILLFTVAAAAQQYRFESWTTNDGLPQNSVRAIVATTDGYLWMGTFEGLVRFDGVDFTVFDMVNTPELKSNYVRALIEDRNKDLWIGIDGGGLVRRTGNRFFYYSKSDGFFSNNVSSLVEARDGSIWIGAEESGLSVLRDGKFTNFTTADGLCDNDIWALAEDSDGGIWIGTDSCLSKFKDGKFQVLTSANGLSSNNVRAIRKAQNGDIWIGTANGLDLFRTGNFVKFDAQKDFSGKFVQSIWEDNDKTLWVGTNRNGLYQLDQTQLKTSKLISKADEDVSAIYQDSENQLWIGTFLNGLYKFRPPRIQTFSVSDEAAKNYVSAVFQDKSGNLWFGSPDGLNQIKDGAVINVSISDKIPGSVGTIAEDKDGNIWVGGNGIFKYDGEKYTHFTSKDGLSKDYVFSMIGDRDGNIWVGTYDGLNLFKSGKFTVFTKKDGLVDGYILSLFEDREGAIWIGTREGVSRYKDGKFTNWTTADGIANNRIFAFYEDRDGAMWIGTSGGGMNRLKDGKLTTITSRDGLYDSLAFAILEDDSGNFWMSGNKGIYRASRAELNDFADGKIKAVSSFSYGTADGMLSRECNGANPAGWKTRDGNLWFPTIAGLVKVDARELNFAPPKVLIEQIQIDGKLQPENEFLEINPNQENTEIKFTAISWQRPQQIKFKYRLENLDKDWIDVGTRRTAYFSRLPAGEYTFRVIADNGDGVWNLEGETLLLKVLPPFYATWWFRLFTIFIIGAILFTIYRRRVANFRQKQAQQEEFSRRLINAHESERSRIAAELHDSIGQSLAMIKNRAIFGTMKVTDEETKEHLEHITAQTSQTINEVREISYNLRPYLLDRLGLTQAIRSLLDEIADLHQIKVETRINDIDGLFDKEREMSVYRIIQESLNNVIKHADASVVSVLVEKKEKILTISIEDNGKGFDTNRTKNDDVHKGGFGLLGMSERIKMLGGKYSIASKIGRGTKININVVLSKTYFSADGK